MKEMIIGSVLGLTAGIAWKIQHWNERRRTEEYYAAQAQASSK